MRWHPISGVNSDAIDSPYLLEGRDREQVEIQLKRRGFRLESVDARNIRSERDASLAVGRALGYPSFYRGGWDAFFDLLSTEFQEHPRTLVVGISNADEFAHGNLRLFVKTCWHLLNATETIESEGGGGWQLEFIYWGNWKRNEDVD